MENTIATLTSYIPADIDFLSMLKFVGIFAAGFLILGTLGRIILGKRSSLNHAVSSSIGIFFIYVMTVVIYTLNPMDLAQYLSPLPFVSFQGDTLYLMSLKALGFPALCSQILSLVILAFLVNLLDTFIPKGKNVIGWYLWRVVSVVLAIVLHIIVTWLIDSYLPDMLVNYASVILLAILAVMLILGVLKAVLGLVLTIANPIIGAIYTFFFANIIGKQLSKAVLTTILLCAVFFALGHFGYAAIAISASTWGSYIPLITAALILWYLIGHLL